MEALYLDCGVRKPQLKRTPLGSPSTGTLAMRPHLIALQTAILTLVACSPAKPTASSAPQVTSCAGKLSSDSTVYDTSQVSEKPIRRSGPLPVYPDDARTEGIEGTVIVSVVINPDGKTDPASVRIVQRPDARLEQSAAQVVLGTAFWPACRAGLAVRLRVAIPITYRIARD